LLFSGTVFKADLVSSQRRPWHILPSKQELGLTQIDSMQLCFRTRPAGAAIWKGRILFTAPDSDALLASFRTAAREIIFKGVSSGHGALPDGIDIVSTPIIPSAATESNVIVAGLR